MLCCVTGYTDPSVLKDHTAFSLDCFIHERTTKPVKTRELFPSDITCVRLESLSIYIANCYNTYLITALQYHNWVFKYKLHFLVYQLIRIKPCSILKSFYLGHTIAFYILQSSYHSPSTHLFIMFYKDTLNSYMFIPFKYVRI